MNLKKYRNSYEVLSTLIIVLLIYYSGSIYSISIYHKTIVFVFAGIAIAFFLLYGRKRISTIHFAIMQIIVISILVVALLWEKESFNPYIALIIQFISTFLIAQGLNIVDFEKKYIFIMKWLAILSLLAFLIGLFFPSFIFIFPRTAAIADCDYYNAGIYVYNVALYNGKMLRRNNGIFWEAGCYQAFLNLAIFLCIKHKIEFGVKNVGTMLILGFTILTTYSFTGILVLGLLILFYVIKFGRRKSESIVICVSGLCVIFLFTTMQSIWKLFYRVEEYLNNPSDIFARLNLDIIGVIFGNDSGTFLRGMTFSQFSDQYSGVSNSIIYYFACLGIVFGICVCTIYFKYAKYISIGSGIVYLILVIICCSAEALWVSPLFLMPGMLSVLKRREDIKL